MIPNLNTITANPGHLDLIQFADFHRVSLNVGNYTLDVTQSINGESWTPAHSTQFSVLAERYQLAQNAIRAVFPPSGSQGDYWHTLPHLVLERSTLPWERTAYQTPVSPRTDIPWLALIVLHTDNPEEANIQVNIEAKARADLKEGETEQAKVIKVPIDLIPTAEDLNQLTHIRRRLAFIKKYETLADAKTELLNSLEQPEIHEIKDADALKALPGSNSNNPKEKVSQAWLVEDLASKEKYEILQYGTNETALIVKVFHVAHEASTVLAKRLPKPNTRNIVHLVSLESVYDTDKNLVGVSDNKVALVSLHQWEFYCEAEQKTFKQLLLNMDVADWKLDRPDITDSTAKEFLNKGFIPLKHRFREGSRSVSWYHGPLMPTQLDLKQQQLPFADIKHADQLMLYDEVNGLFDVSYAAAWELGRMLTLQNTKLALALYNWKRQHAHQLYAVRHLIDFNYHLPIDGGHPQLKPDGTAIWKWLDELSLLEHLPFNYLVPDPDLLPPESFRFFKVDKLWVDLLRDGAFSIGSVFNKDAKLDNALLEKEQESITNGTTYSGFLMRSEVVAGWPDLKMSAYKELPSSSANGPIPDRNDANVLLPVRKVQLSKQVLLVLFKGVVKAVDFYLPPETLHFGLDTPDHPNLSNSQILSDHPDLLIKQRRDLDSGVVDTDDSHAAQVTFTDLSKRIVDINILASDLADGSTVHAGTTAVQLILGNDLVRIALQ